jgi:hypothetical protein
LLDTVVPEVNFVHPTVGESIRRLSRKAGVPVRLADFPLPGSAPPAAGEPPTMVKAAGWLRGRGPPGTLRGLTVRQLLRRLLDNSGLVQDVAVTDDGSQVTLGPPVAQPGSLARVYEIGDLLARPPDGRAARTAKMLGQLPMQWPPTPAPAAARTTTGAPVATLTSPRAIRVAEVMTAVKESVSGRTFRFGDRLICVGNQESQRNAQDVLAEERAKPVAAPMPSPSPTR